MMTTDKFRESQRFSSVWWLKILLLIPLVLIIWSIVQQIILGIPFGNNPAPDEFLILFSIIPLAGIIIVYTLRLDTIIDSAGIHCRWFPFQRGYKLFKWDSMGNVFVREYRPIYEYGGWGIRGGFHGKAYNVSGNIGIQIEFKDGKRLLIGTAKKEEVEYSILRFRR